MALRVFSHPFRLDGNGAVATVEQWSDQQAQQVGLAICATTIGERPLAPLFGISDPVGAGVEYDALAAAVDVCEPDLLLVGADIDGPDTDGRQTVTVTVAWRTDDTEDEVT
jgi:hypothetical protein